MSSYPYLVVAQGVHHNVSATQIAFKTTTLLSASRHDIIVGMGIELNSVGDMLLDSAAIQALAEDGQYELLEALRKHDPATAGALNADVAKLGALAAAGLVTGPDEAHRWVAVGRGLFSHPQLLPAVRR